MTERDDGALAWPGCRPVPGRPGRRAPGARAVRRSLARRLFDQRVVLLHGPLDDLTVTRVSAELMTLDAEGDEPSRCGSTAARPPWRPP